MVGSGVEPGCTALAVVHRSVTGKPGRPYYSSCTLPIPNAADAAEPYTRGGPLDRNGAIRDTLSSFGSAVHAHVLRHEAFLPPPPLVVDPDGAISSATGHQPCEKPADLVDIAVMDQSLTGAILFSMATGQPKSPPPPGSDLTGTLIRRKFVTPYAAARQLCKLQNPHISEPLQRFVARVNYTEGVTSSLIHEILTLCSLTITPTNLKKSLRSRVRQIAGGLNDEFDLNNYLYLLLYDNVNYEAVKRSLGRTDAQKAKDKEDGQGTYLNYILKVFRKVPRDEFERVVGGCSEDPRPDDEVLAEFPGGARDMVVGDTDYDRLDDSCLARASAALDLAYNLFSGKITIQFEGDDELAEAAADDVAAVAAGTRGTVVPGYYPKLHYMGASATAVAVMDNNQDAEDVGAEYVFTAPSKANLGTKAAAQSILDEAEALGAKATEGSPVCSSFNPVISLMLQIWCLCIHLLILCLVFPPLMGTHHPQRCDLLITPCLLHLDHCRWLGSAASLFSATETRLCNSRGSWKTTRTSTRMPTSSEPAASIPGLKPGCRTTG